MAEPTNQNQTIDIQEELLNRYEALPQDLKETMMSVETAETIFEIGKKFGLNIEKTGKLAEEIGFVILGVVPSKDFVTNLKDVLEIDADKALGVASEVNHRIFLAIRDTLKTLHGVRWVDQIAEKPTEVAQNKPFEAVIQQTKPAETVEKNKEQIPSILVEIKPSEEKPTPITTSPDSIVTGQATEKPSQPIPTEIKPEAPEQKISPVPPLDTSHEIAAHALNSQQPTANNQPASVKATAGRPPEGLPIEQPSTQAPHASVPPSSKNYLVDPYREPFE